MSDSEDTKPDANKLLTCKLEFEAHDDEDMPDLSGWADNNKPSIEQTSVNPNSLLDSSDDKTLISSASGDSLLKDRRNSSVEQTSGVNPDFLLDDDEEFTEELLRSASGETSKPKMTKHDPKSLTCYICKKEFGHKRELLLHWQMHKSNSKSCNVCGKAFVNMDLLNKHSMVHFEKDARKNPFVCKKCDCAFAQKQDFISHALFFKHGENRIFKCDVCRGFFVNESDLKSHLATHEGRTKVLRCEECGETFEKRLDLRSHMVSHIGERNYKCDLCNLTFKSKFVLSKHQEAIHSSKLVCSICNLSFSKKDKKNYDFHVKLHSK